MFYALVNRSLEKYKQYHLHPKNNLVHLFGIPLIMIGLAIALPFWAAVSILVAYLLLAFWEGLAITVLSLFTILFAGIPGEDPWVAWYVGVIILAVSLAVQIWAHRRFEGSYPAFVKHPEHIWVAPIWWVREFLGPSFRS